VGMIAEEVGEVLPEIVSYEPDGTYTSGMDYSRLTPLLVEAVKVLNRKTAEMEDKLSKLESLRKENTDLHDRVKTLEALVGQMARDISGVHDELKR
jgi:ppGpp synthetase/RelA/SpoT-type nucleotidyltranferase